MFRRKPSQTPGTTAQSIPSSPIVPATHSPTGKPQSPPQTVPATSSPMVAVKYNNGSVVEGDYRLEKTIGKGSYGKVKLATHLPTGGKVALKFISRASIKKPTHWTRIRREINLLRAMHHPHIVKLHDYKDNGSDILLMMEYIAGGDLFDRIVHHRDQRYSEKEARPLFRQIISAVDYCHQNRIIHRDLKPENLMVDDKNQIKLIDFGFANIYSPRGHLETNCGSPLYASPEIVQGVKYVGPEVDIWSLGVILFAMLTGTLPFEDEQLKGLYAKICAGNYIAPAYLSQEARDLLRMMLTVDPKQRATMKDIKFSPWIMNGSMYPPENFMPFRQPLTRSGMTMNVVREDIVAALEDYGFTDAPATAQMVLYQPDSPAYTLYCLLLEREQRTAKSRGASAGASGMSAMSAMGASVAAFPLGATSIAVTGVTATTSPALSSIAIATKVPMQPISINRTEESDSLLESPPGSVSAKMPRIAPPSPSSGHNLVAQAAAHVASRFRKLRDMNFGRTQVVTTSANNLSDVARPVNPSPAAPFTIVIPSGGGGAQHVHGYHGAATGTNHMASPPVVSTTLHHVHSQNHQPSTMTARPTVPHPHSYTARGHMH